MSGVTIDTRVEVLERDVRQINSGLNEVKSILNEVAKSVSTAPRPIHLPTIAGTIVSVISIIVVIANVAEYWQRQNSAVLTYRVEQLEKKYAIHP